MTSAGDEIPMTAVKTLPEADPKPEADSKLTKYKSSKTSPDLGDNGRRRSESDAPGGQLEGVMTAARSLRKYKTYCQTQGADRERHSSVRVSPEALAKLHKLHEVYMKIKDPERFKQLEDITTARIMEAFSKGESWQVHPLLPEKEKERPLHKRPMDFWGAKQKGWIPGAEAEAALRHWGAAMTNTKGLKGVRDTSIGQDNCSIATLRDGWEVFCVMDGHGVDGHWASTRASQTLPFFLQESGCAQMLQAGGFEAALTTAFEKVEDDLEIKAHEEDIRLHFSGTTATVAVRDKVRDDLWVAHVGDSRAVLLVPGEGVVYSTTDHKPTLEDEARRVEESGCVIEHTEYEDGEIEDRIYIKGEDFPGLNMTRSFGDIVVKDHGVIATPEVRRWCMSKYKTAYYLACSDGVWEFMSNEEVSDLVLGGLEEGKSCVEVAEELLKRSQMSWKVRDPEYMDDITILLVPLDDSTRPAGGFVTSLLVCGDCLDGIRKGNCRIM